MRLAEIRDNFKSKWQASGWHFIEGNLEDIDKYVDIQKRKVLFRWGEVSGDWLTTRAQGQVFFYAGDFLRIASQTDVNKDNEYKTNKLTEMLADIKTVLNSIVDPETAIVQPAEDYTLRFFEERFQENLTVIEIEFNFIDLEFYCDNPYAER